MPIKTLQQRLSQVGVIRLGELLKTAAGKPYPSKLDTFRITSPYRPLIDAVAELFGGEVRAWQPQSGGPQWEVITRVTEISVFVPPQRIDPNYELWGKGYRARLCDGETEKTRGCACLCEAGARQRYAAQGRTWPADGQFERTKDDCKPTTRMSLMIADIPAGVGTFKLESHGWNAAAELPTLAESIASAPQPIPAVLRLEQREGGVLKIVGGQEKVEPRKYAVPVLDFFGLFTPRQVFSGELGSAVRAAIGAGPQGRKAIASGRGETPEPPAGTGPDWLVLIAGAGTTAELNALRERMRQAGLRDERVVEAWKARGAEVARVARAEAEPVVEAEVEPDRDATWTAILRVAKEHGWNLPAVEGRYRDRMGHDPADEDLATGWKLAEFLRAVKAGEVR